MFRLSIVCALLDMVQRRYPRAAAGRNRLDAFDHSENHSVPVSDSAHPVLQRACRVLMTTIFDDSAISWIMSVEHFTDIVGASFLMYTAWWQYSTPLTVSNPIDQHLLSCLRRLTRLTSHRSLSSVSTFRLTSAIAFGSSRKHGGSLHQCLQFCCLASCLPSSRYVTTQSQVHASTLNAILSDYIYSASRRSKDHHVV